MVTPPKNQRLWILFAFVLAVGGLLFLSTAISQMEFAPAQLFFLESEQQTPPVGKMGFRTWNLEGAWKSAGILLFWGILPLSLIYFIVSPEVRKIILRRAVAMSLSAYAFFLMMRSCGQLSSQELFNFSGVDSAAQTQTRETALALSPQSAIWLQWAANIIFVGLLAVLFWRALQWWQARPASLRGLSAEAGLALDNLSAGADLGDTILRCYLEMNRLVHRRRGLRRKAAATPREFTAELIRSGLPESDVHQLTRLFEMVRYSGRPLGATEGRQAEASLRAIFEAGQGEV